MVAVCLSSSTGEGLEGGQGAKHGCRSAWAGQRVGGGGGVVGKGLMNGQRGEGLETAGKGGGKRGERGGQV